jgi:hypothetical protein
MWLATARSRPGDLDQRAGRRAHLGEERLVQARVAPQLGVKRHGQQRALARRDRAALKLGEDLYVVAVGLDPRSADEDGAQRRAVQAGELEVLLRLMFTTSMSLASAQSIPQARAEKLPEPSAPSTLTAASGVPGATPTTPAPSCSAAIVPATCVP